MKPDHVSTSDIRSAFSAAMSAMYREEVPAYGTLMELVARVNDETLAAQPKLKERLAIIEGDRHLSLGADYPEMAEA